MTPDLSYDWERERRGRAKIINEITLVGGYGRWVKLINQVM